MSSNLTATIMDEKRMKRMLETMQRTERVLANHFWQHHNLVAYTCILCEELTLSEPENLPKCETCGGPTTR